MEQEVDYKNAWHDLKNMLFYQMDLLKSELAEDEEKHNTLNYVLERMLNLQDLHTK